MALEVQIPNQRYRNDLGGRLYLHLSARLAVLDAVLRIRYISFEQGYELRPLGRELGGALLNVALHHAADLGHANYRDELRDRVKRTPASHRTDS